MSLGTILSKLESEADAAAALDALGDVVLFAEVETMGVRYDETPSAYIGAAVRRFTAQASHEEWFALSGAVQRGTDPGRSALSYMLRWALARDAGDLKAQHTCGCQETPSHGHR
jgi:hypothetical protein